MLFFVFISFGKGKEMISVNHDVQGAISSHCLYSETLRFTTWLDLDRSMFLGEMSRVFIHPLFYKFTANDAFSHDGLPSHWCSDDIAYTAMLMQS